MNRIRGAVLLSVWVLAACEGRALAPAELGLSTPGERHGLGLSVDPAATSSRVAGVQTFALSDPPLRVDLSAFNPPVGDQGGLGSCVSWSEGWGLMGWYARRRAETADRFAPMYLYSQLCRVPTCGSSLQAPLAILQKQGIAEWDFYNANVSADASSQPFAAYDYLTVPSDFAPLLANAALHRVSGARDVFLAFTNGGPGPCRTVAGGAQAIRAALAEGAPVVIGFPVGYAFDTYNASSPPVPALAEGESYRGLHAVLATRYDENGLWIQNQWGTGWGNGGWAQLSWDFVDRCNIGVVAATGIADPVSLQLSATIQSPSTGQTVQSLLYVTLNATPGPQFTLAQVQILVDGVAVGSATRQGAFDYAFFLNTTVLANGPHALGARAIDVSGTSVDTAPVAVVVDNKPREEAQVLFRSPAAQSLVRGSITVSISAVFPEDGVVGGQPPRDGGKETAIGLTVDDGQQLTHQGTEATFDLNTAALRDGPHVLRATAIGREGALGSATLTVFTDNTAPEVTLLEPSPGTTLRGTVTLRATSPESAVSFYANDFLIGTGAIGADGSQTLEWNTSTLSDGPVVITGRASDVVGNTGSSAPVAVTIVNTQPPEPLQPLVRIQSPIGGVTVSGTVTVHIETENLALTSMDLLIDGHLADQRQTQGPAVDWSWATPAVSNGPHVLQAIAHRAGNTDVASVEVQITVLNVAHGLKAEYFGGQSFEKRLFTRVDPTIDFNWKSGGPAPRVEDFFTIRWTGTIRVPGSTPFLLGGSFDDGGRVWVNGELVIDTWSAGMARMAMTQRSLPAGTPLDLRVEYTERKGNASAQLLWVGAGLRPRAVPTEFLTPAP